MRRKRRRLIYRGTLAGLVLLGTCVFAFGCLAESSVPSWCELEQPSQRPAACGVNALYVLLRANGILVDHQELLDECAVDPVKGMSLGELSRIATRYGLAVQMLKSDPDHLADLAVPFIAHLDANETTGHFVVVTRVGNGSVSVIDGINGNYDDYRLGAFERSWTGFALTASDRSVLEVILSFSLCCLVWLLLHTAFSWFCRLSSHS
jgi:ABC-type bacteriocin/lantibiotic exporter with double-glycine peptidase domain